MAKLVAMAALGEMQISDYRDVLAEDRDAAEALWAKLPPCTLDEIPPDSPFLDIDHCETEDASWCPLVRLEHLKLPVETRKELATAAAQAPAKRKRILRGFDR